METNAWSAVRLPVFRVDMLNRTVSPGAGFGGSQDIVLSKFTVGQSSKGVVSSCGNAPSMPKHAPVRRRAHFAALGTVHLIT